VIGDGVFVDAGFFGVQLPDRVNARGFAAQTLADLFHDLNLQAIVSARSIKRSRFIIEFAAVLVYLLNASDQIADGGFEPCDFLVAHG
jgi:hypothetical protein